MSKPAEIPHFANAYVAWLVCLFMLISKVRREGLLSIEGEVENVEYKDSIFQQIPQVLTQPYLGFATDILRMMVAGNLNADELQVYAEQAIAVQEKQCKWFFSRVDVSLLRTIWLVLWATMKGNAPTIACEYGRQVIPVKLKPSFIELEDLLRSVKNQTGHQGWSNKEGGMDAAVDDFMATLN